MAEATFQKVKRTEEPMYGNPGVLVCGYPPDEHGLFSKFLVDIGLEDLPVMFACTKDLDRPLKELLARETRAGSGGLSEMRRAVILSGVTQNQLHRILSAYRMAKLPAQLWATLTPTSENWNLSDLLEELAAESAAVRGKGAGPGS